MYNERENFLRTLSGDHPDHFVNEWEPFELIDDNPPHRPHPGAVYGRRDPTSTTFSAPM